jgi:uncharacterized membrane protein HdeD (DUF308 family)
METIEKQLAGIFSYNWWALLLRGLVAIIFGVLTFVLPMMSLRVLVILFGTFVLVDGMLGVWIAIAGRKEYRDWWALLLWGLVGIGVGILTVAAPGVTTIALLLFIAVWAVTTGVLEIVIAIRLRRDIEGEWMLIAGGLLSVVFGVLLMVQPEAGALAVIWLIGAYAVSFGLVLVILAIKLRGFVRKLGRTARAAGRVA